MRFVKHTLQSACAFGEALLMFLTMFYIQQIAVFTERALISLKMLVF